MLWIRLAVLLVSASALMADQHSVDSDPNAEFSKYHTFAIRQGNINAKQPELNSPLVRQRLEDAIRQQLTSKGLEEDPKRPDLLVNFHLGAARKQEVQSWPAGRWGRARRLETYRFTEGTLVIDLLQRGGRELVWRGVYNDEEKDAANLSKKLTGDIKKLFEDYPPKKK